MVKLTKIISLLLVMVMLFSVCSCHKNVVDLSDGTESESSTASESDSNSNDKEDDNSKEADDKEADDKEADDKETDDKETDDKETDDKETDNKENDNDDGDKKDDNESGGDGDAHSHEYKREVIEPTYAIEGKATYSCECGDSYTEKIAKRAGIPLISEKEQSTIIIAGDASRHVLYARDKIQLEFKAISGLALSEGEDTPFEILIGDTGRAESIALKANLGADEYAIRIINKKIVIVASNEAFLYEAAKYFCDNYLKSPHLSVNGEEIVLLTEEIDVRREGDKGSVHYNVSTGALLNAVGVATYTLENEKYGATDADPRIYRRQGGCFNGEIYYQVFITKNEDLAVVARKNVITGELIYSEPRLMDHANDATYNPNNNRLYVGNGKSVWIYDGDTLEFIESITLSHSTSRISYSYERNTFVLGNYYFYDDTLTYTGEYFKSKLGTLYGDLSLSSQGTACDDTFVYSLLFETVRSGVYNAYLGIFDWYGNTLAFVTIEIPGDFEPENVSAVDGKLYIAACSTQPVATLYEVAFVS